MACGDRQCEPILESKTNQIKSIIKPAIRYADGRMGRMDIKFNLKKK